MGKLSEIKREKIGVLDDPLGQSHSHASNKNYFNLFFVFFGRFKYKGDGRTDVRHVWIYW